MYCTRNVERVGPYCTRICSWCCVVKNETNFRGGRSGLVRCHLHQKPVAEICLAGLAFLSLNQFKFYLDQETTVYAEIVLIPESQFCQQRLAYVTTQDLD
jgi:hypothetical protein